MIVDAKTNTTYYVFTHVGDVTFYCRKFERITFTDDFLKIDQGQITVLGSQETGYAWDGCSPKFYLWEVYFGTPDGIIGERGKPKTYYASMVHDLLYQHRVRLGKEHKVKRKDVDQLFLDELKKEGFKLAQFYYVMVRIFGGLYWYNIMEKVKVLKYFFRILLVIMVFLTCEAIRNILLYLVDILF